MPDNISQKIRSLSATIKEKEKTIELISKDIKESRPDITRPIKETKLHNLKIAGIDGGLLKKEYSSISLIITRAIGVIFSYADGKLQSTQYVPNAVIEPTYTITDSMDDQYELDRKASIIRIGEEINRAIECANKKPDIIILDGTIIPHPSTEPQSNSSLNEKYNNLFTKIKELIDTCAKNNILLAGVCEDSRTNSFCKNLKIKEDICTDTQLTTYLLKTNERTISYQTDLPKKYISLKHLIHNIIIKPTEHDKTIRIQFIAQDRIEEHADKISGIINQISSYHSEYAAPTVLIEADQRAKLSNRDLLFIENEIRTGLGSTPSMLELRRNRRPL